MSNIAEAEKKLVNFVRMVADIESTGGDPDVECSLCMGELQDEAKHLLQEVEAGNRRKQ
jgi:hypothetical protein